MNKTDRQIAFHEAGHTAIQLVFEQMPQYVTLTRKKEMLAHALHLDGDRDSEEGLRKLVINCYAGREAEMRVGGDGSGSCQDDEEALGYLKVLGIDEEEMRSATADCVTEHWNLIERIAEELLERTTLIFEELDYLHAICRDEETEEELKALRNGPMFDSFLQGIAADGLERT
jgi:hypothetical protein